MKVLTLVKRVAEFQKMTTTDSFYIPLQLQLLLATFGTTERDLTAHELYQIVKAIFTPSASTNSRQPSDDKSNQLQWLYYIFNCIFVDMIASETGDRFCHLSVADESSIYTLFKAMQDFNILTDATFDLIILNLKYALMLIERDEFKDLVVTGYRLQLTPPFVTKLDNLHVYNEDDETFIEIVDIANPDNMKKIQITPRVPADLKEKIGLVRENTASQSSDQLTFDEYADLKRIILNHHLRLQNKLTPEIFKLFFIGLPLAIVLAVENHFIEEQLYSHKKCLESMMQNNIGQLFENDTEIQFAVQKVLKGEFNKHFNAVYFMRVKTYPSFTFLKEAIRLIDYSQLNYNVVQDKAAKIFNEQSAITKITSIFGRSREPLPIIIPGVSAPTAKR